VREQRGSMSHELLSDVTFVELGESQPLAVAGRLLAQLGASRVHERSNARIFLVDEMTTDAHLNRSAQTIVAHVAKDADDLLLQADGGICAGIGEPTRPPLKLPLDQSAQQGGLVLAIAVCAALFSDGAQRVDLSMRDVWKTFYSGPDVANARFGRAKTRRGGHRAAGVPWPRTILPCKDGFFAIQCATRDHWQRFLAMTGKPELESAPLFADRVKANDLHGDEADRLFADWFRARTKAELTRAFLEAKLPGAPVYAINSGAPSAIIVRRIRRSRLRRERQRTNAAGSPPRRKRR
jgi:crotonobetainyl-CoA:carnitine CoA-transferase CaiB-like acyl-CoA transferase